LRLDSPTPGPLDEFGYGDVTLSSPLHEEQLHETHAVEHGMYNSILGSRSLQPGRAF
jgi:hypothetical protein